jgi:hypothetical protein
MTGRLIFVESPAQAAHIVRNDVAGICVALSAEAAQAFDELGHPYEPVCRFTDTYALADIDERLTVEVAAAMLELDTFVAEHVPSTRFDGPGVFYSQAYPVQYSVGAVLKRLFLMRAALEALRPQTVLAYTGPIDPWFSQDGYTRNPWIAPLEALVAQRGIALKLEAGPRLRDARPLIRRGNLWGRIVGKLRAELRRLLPAVTPPLAGTLGGLRILVVDVVAFDWIQTVKVLRSAPDVQCWVAGSEAVDEGHVRVAFRGTLTRPDGSTETVAVENPPAPEGEEQAVATAVDQWCAANPERLRFLGFSLLDAIKPHLHSLARLGPTLIRRTDAIAEKFLDIVQPHALCYMSIGKVTDMRLAHVARKRGIPNVTYQHGFAYGVQILAKDEFTDPMNADYFLVYGPKIRPRAEPAFPVRARYVPVGSARIEEMVRHLRPRRARGDLRALWIAETSTRNTLTPSLNEDTRRYLAQQRCFEKLSGARGLRVTYRPYRHSFDYEGTQRWLRARRFANVRTDIGSRLEYLIASHDVVICETSSPTTWIEVLALRVPLILYCDPRQTLLVPEFERDLAAACHWARDYQALYGAVCRLADDRAGLLAELRAIDPTRFVADYALDRRDCATRAATFLSQVCRAGRTVDSWRATANAA